ncbi:hypothetical protein [Mycolicibacterium arabiense]|uniref:hypothetical protein n=1 Tax=Mycolicibacterium arabiense TaxID=1286181 RepID=UPI001F2B6920|nr:hypothetical protein [Mycolicibacterium arabiense]
MTSAVEKFFNPEFFNRIDETVVMKPFETSTARQVTEREVGLFTTRLARESVELRIDDTVVDFLQACGFDPIYGARGLRRTFQTHLTAPAADCVLRSRTTPTAPIVVDATVVNGAIVVTSALHVAGSQHQIVVDAAKAVVVVRLRRWQFSTVSIAIAPKCQASAAVSFHHGDKT